MTHERRRPAASWPASLLPTLMLFALMSAGIVAAATESEPTPVVEMTVITE